MKLIELLSFASLALITAATASAQTTIRIVGSNGDRQATQHAISQLLATGWKFQGVNGNTTSSGSLSTATGANFGAWNGSYGGSNVVIKVSFIGAAGAIEGVASNPRSNTKFVVTDGTGSGSVPSPLTGANELAKADFGLSTVFQATTPFNGTYQGVRYDSLAADIVGVSPLGFYASPGFPGTNITTQLAQQLYNIGNLTADVFTGNTNDANSTVWAIGRNTDAGQRFGAYAEIGLGTTANVRVWFPSITGQTTTNGITYGGTSTNHVLWPESVQPGDIPVVVGSGGYNSGANLAPVLTTTLAEYAYKGSYSEDVEGEVVTGQLYPNATNGYYIGYLTPGDASTRVLGSDNTIPPASRGKALSYNGVELTTANVQSGRYTAWLYNRIIKPSDLTGFKLAFANALVTRIKNTSATQGGGILESSLNVQRFTDGGFVIKK
ncbi:MAG: hypothetical protein K8R57_01165 [Verrucomicrobia bacterium]|nr:hypothetical protein [Verrucomicrobiota bacterium]